MFESMLQDKLKQDCFYLLSIEGDINNPVLLTPDKYYTAKNITNIECVVYNEETDRMSRKSVYMAKDGQLYINGKVNRKNKRLYLKDFSK